MKPFLIRMFGGNYMPSSLGKVKAVDCKKLYFTGQTLYSTMIFFHFLVYLQFGNYWMNFQQKKVSAKNSRIVMERGESFLLEYFFFVFSFYAVYYTRAASLTFYQFLQRKKVHMIWHTYTWVHTFCYSYSSLGMNPLKCPLKMYFKFK